VGRKTATKRGIEEKSIGNHPPLPGRVDVIAEDDEDPSSPLISPTSGRVLPFSKRAGASQFDANGRTRAISTSQIQAGAVQNLTRKYSSLSAKGSLPASQKRSAPGPGPLELSDRPNRTRKVQRDARDMDLDDILNGSDEEKAESRTLSSFKTPRPAKISKSARDLIDFLDEGPPAELTPPPPPQSQVASSPKSTGRFRRMVSKLTGSSSNERLREDAAKLRKTAPPNSVFNATNGTTNYPQSPVKRVPTVVVATPPPRLQSIPQQVTPPDSPPTVNQDSLRPVQRRTSVRKKVPPVDPYLETSVHSPTTPSAPRVASNEYSRPLALTNGNGQLNRVDEVHKPVSPPSSSPEPLEPRARAETIASDEKIAFQRPTPTPPAKIMVETPTPVSLPVTIRPPSSQHIESSLNAANAQSLRQLMSTASTADECRVLVDMFLARVGFPIDRSTNMDPYPSPISSTDPSDVDLESSVIETLLGGDSSSSPSTPVHSSQPSEAFQADESEVGTSDGETYDDDINSSIRYSPSGAARDAGVNRSFPPPARLLAVA